MRVASFWQKNKIIKHLVPLGTAGDHSSNIARVLKMDHSTVYVLCHEMNDEGHIDLLKTSTVGHFFTCHVSILPAGEYFYKSEGYVWRFVKIATIDFPKNFWWITALVAFWAGNDFKCLPSKESNQQEQRFQQIERRLDSIQTQ